MKTTKAVEFGILTGDLVCLNCDDVIHFEGEPAPNPFNYYAFCTEACAKEYIGNNEVMV